MSPALRSRCASARIMCLHPDHVCVVAPFAACRSVIKKDGRGVLKAVGRQVASYRPDLKVSTGPYMPYCCCVTLNCITGPCAAAAAAAAPGAGAWSGA